MSKKHRKKPPQERLQQIYDQVPGIRCKGLCHDECTILLMSRTEYERLLNGAGEIPPATSGACPLLTEDKRCSAYADRPLVCRQWGVVSTMRCTHGCVPERVLSREAAFAMNGESFALTEGHSVITLHDNFMPTRTSMIQGNDSIPPGQIRDDDG